MTLPARASFVMQEYRYETVSDPAILTKYPASVDLTIETALSLTVANTIGTKVFNVVKLFAEAYEVTVEGIYTSDIFDTTVPSFVLDDPAYQTDGRTFKTCGMIVDWTSNTTTFVIRG